jgi:SAM-dependent methyltransferase
MAAMSEGPGASVEAAWDARYAASELVWSAEPNQTVAELAFGLTPGRAADLACGEGRNALALARLGWRVTAVDISGVALDKGRAMTERDGLDVEWVHGDVLQVPLPESAFDLVVLAYVQLPADAQVTLLGRAAAMLAPGGRLLVVAHDADNVTRGYGGPPDPAVCYTVERTRSALDGLEIERLGQVTRTVEKDGARHDAVDLVAFARRPQAA